MSAHIVDHEHIHALIGAGLTQPAVTLRWQTEAPEDFANGAHRSIYPYAGGRYRELRPDTASIVGQMLVAANRASVNALYPQDGNPLPQPYEYDPTAGRRHFEPVEILLAIAGFEHQACEIDNWEMSEAARFCAALRKHIVSLLPGYDLARTWAIGPETPTLRDIRAAASTA
ncbi:hypothetical protein [Agromyces bauzanensis]